MKRACIRLPLVSKHGPQKVGTRFATRPCLNNDLKRDGDMRWAVALRRFRPAVHTVAPIMTDHSLKLFANTAASMLETTGAPCFVVTAAGSEKEEGAAMTRFTVLFVGFLRACL